MERYLVCTNTPAIFGVVLPEPARVEVFLIKEYPHHYEDKIWINPSAYTVFSLLFQSLKNWAYVIAYPHMWGK